jgi:hypothetical protein
MKFARKIKSKEEPVEKIQIDLASNCDENKDKINCSNKKKKIHFKTLNVHLDDYNDRV